MDILKTLRCSTCQWSKKLISELNDYDESKEVSADHASDETFPRLLGWKLDERCFAKPHSEYIGHDIISDHAKLRENKPKDAFINVVWNECWHAKYQNKCEHGPRKSLELIAIWAFFEGPNEEQYAEHKEPEWYQFVVVVEYEVHEGACWDSTLNQYSPHE